MKKILSFILFLMCGYCVFSQELDTIHLYNGQILIGEIKGAKLGVITIDDKDLKFVKIKMYKIKHMVATRTQFRLQTNAKKFYYTTLQPSDQPGTVIIQDGIGSVTLHLSDISILLPIEQGFFKKLNGNFGMGFSFTKSSNIGQANLNSTMYYTTKKVDYQLSLSAIASIDSSKFSRDNENMELFASYAMTSSWFVSGSLNYQRNLELSLNRRYQELAGIGNKLVLNRTWQLWALSGLSLGQEKSTQGVESVTLEVPFMLRFNFFKYQQINMQLYATQTFYVSLTDAGRVRYDGSLNYSHELVHNFYLTINFYSNYDSKPTDANSSTTDYGTSLSVSYKF
jgi:hypothetical protein